MAKDIAGLIEPKSKPLAPIRSYEVDLGKGKPLIIEANRIDQSGEWLIFIIEYSDYNLYVAGFSSWKSYRLIKEKPASTAPLPAKTAAPLPTKKPLTKLGKPEQQKLF